AQILFDSGFVLFLHFGVICQYAYRAEVLAAVPFVGGEKFLDGFAGVGAVVQDLGQGGMARADRRQVVAEEIGFFLRFLPDLLQFRDAGLYLRCLLLEFGGVAYGFLPIFRRAFSTAWSCSELRVAHSACCVVRALRSRVICSLRPASSELRV